MDVAVTNDHTIWAVGEIHTPETDQFDSLGNWVPHYNAVHRDEEKWGLFRFYKKTNSVISEIRGIGINSQGEIWLASGSIYKWNGNIAELSYRREINTFEMIDRLWVDGSDNILGVGNEGLVVRYDGLSWNKIESGTTVYLRDIWGTSSENVWMCGYTSDYSNSILMRWDGAKTKILWEKQNPRGIPYFYSLSSLWASNERFFYVVNNTRIFRHSQKNLENVFQEPIRLGNAPYRIRGDAINDIFVVGNDAMIWHFNGATWHHYAYLQNNFDKLKSVSVTEHLVCAVGERYLNGVERYGVIYLGRR
ncbi:MAG TPA: hypothetical protein ENK14_05710 [Caldithrix sp.]|nr:hypothetical protein [Caldithrix sp.]